MIDRHVLPEAIRDQRGQIIDFRLVEVSTAAREYDRWPRERLIGSTLVGPDFFNDPARKACA
jgi:hypothetical protein